LERYNYELPSTLTKSITITPGRSSLKRTTAAYTILLGFTAIMIGLYINEFKVLTDILRAYVLPLP
jgi:hypothetical protein